MIDYNFPKNSEKWSNEDYYQHYLLTKRFGFSTFRSSGNIFDKNQYDEIKQRISFYKELYFFIYNKLHEDYKNEFKLDFLDNLKATKEKQKLTKFKEIISNLIIEIDKQPQQSETKKPDEVKKELHKNIFIGNAFELFEKYYNNKAMNFQSRTDFRFLFEQMKIDNLIHETVSLGQYIKFIGKYDYVEKELKSIEMNTTKNIQRTKDYNEYKDNLKTTLK